MTIDKHINKRRSLTLFDNKEITEEELKLLFEAARWAPSSFNVQPWRFIPARKSDKHYTDLLECLSLNNKKWASKAPLLILVIGQEISDYKNKANYYFMHDSALAFSNLAYQAISMGIFTHPMGGFDHKKARNKFGIPEGYEPILMVAAGYNEKMNNLSDSEQKAENAKRSRKLLNEIVFDSEWDNQYFKT